jgi:hypothetical protein
VGKILNKLKDKINEEIIKPVLLKERKNIIQLFKNTSSKRKSKAQNDVVVKLKTISNKGKYQYETTTQSNGNKHRPYIIPILPKTDKSGKIVNKNPNFNSSVIVWCDCKDFQFRWEVALNKNDASRVVNSNGALPVITNPRMRNSLCKHIASAYDNYLNKIKSK